jgi:hypothetical protein
MISSITHLEEDNYFEDHFDNSNSIENSNHSDDLDESFSLDHEIENNSCEENLTEIKNQETSLPENGQHSTSAISVQDEPNFLDDNKNNPEQTSDRTSSGKDVGPSLRVLSPTKINETKKIDSALTQTEKLSIVKKEPFPSEDQCPTTESAEQFLTENIPVQEPVFVPVEQLPIQEPVFVPVEQLSIQEPVFVPVNESSGQNYQSDTYTFKREIKEENQSHYAEHEYATDDEDDDVQNDVHHGGVVKTEAQNNIQRDVQNDVQNDVQKDLHHENAVKTEAPMQFDNIADSADVPIKFENDLDINDDDDDIDDESSFFDVEDFQRQQMMFAQDGTETPSDNNATIR